MNTPTILALTPRDTTLVHAMLTLFGEAFDEAGTYGAAWPDEAYLRKLLGSDSFIALVALEDRAVVGGVAACELRKFERRRSEISLHDLAVAAAHRRRGLATAPITELGKIAASRGAHVIFVQADPGDEPAIALCTKLGIREDALRFDIPVK